MLVKKLVTYSASPVLYIGISVVSTEYADCKVTLKRVFRGFGVIESQKAGNNI